MKRKNPYSSKCIMHRALYVDKTVTTPNFLTASG